MAFQPPIHAPSQPTLLRSEENQLAPNNVLAEQVQPAEWVLFPNARQHPPSWSQTASTSYSPQTAGLSRLSEFGSLDTAALLNNDDEADNALEDDDLDSLDEGLHAFQENLVDQEPAQIDQGASILPTHDGLGTFPGSGNLVQEHIWHFERFNPQRRSFGHYRRRSSVQRRLDTLEVDGGLQIEKERTERIEKWRIEHSSILLEEVEKATRRGLSDQGPLAEATLPDTAIEAPTGKIVSDSFTTPKGSQMHSLEKDAGAVQQGRDGWHRIVRKIVGDLVGINDTTLALVFGEALPQGETHPLYDTSIVGSNPTNRMMALQSSTRWTVSLLENLSKELASLLRYLAQSPAALGSTINPLNLDYAGIPITKPYGQRSAVRSDHHAERFEVDAESTASPLFNPTLNERPKSTGSDFGHAALWGIEEEPTETASSTQDHEYWEQTPSIRTIFRLLHQHFTARRRPLLTSSTFSSSKPSNVATTSTVDSVRRAAVIRQHHPLVSRQSARRSATNNLLGHTYRHHGSYPNLSSPLFRRSESSCASISARKSKRGSGSSRHYWDLRGSVGSGSMGGMGVWGEV
ncbi:MAG: hypothetical protein Q9178_006315 [Gyalolechia marmorata]